MSGIASVASVSILGARVVEVGDLVRVTHE